MQPPSPLFPAEGYSLVRQPRKTICLWVADDLTLQVKAPLRMAKGDIDAFVDGHREWITRQLERVARRSRAHEEHPLSALELAALMEKARLELPARTAHWADRTGLHPTGVKVTSAQSRWGSCSGRNSICLSFRLALLPQELVDYVIVHELAHIIEKNHGPRFYALVARWLPNYRDLTKKLREWQYQLPI